MRAALAPLFDRFSVDLVVQGHKHGYERTKSHPLRTVHHAGPDGAKVDSARNGTTYICCGFGGHPRYAWQPGETDRYRYASGPADDTSAPADSGTEVTSFVAGPDVTTTPEAADWYQTRYRDYALDTGGRVE